MLGRIAAEISRHLTDDNLIAPAFRTFSDDSYARHLVYADPLGRFSVLVLAWLPGQITPIHGHNAWGVVGIHEGTMLNTCFRAAGSAEPIPTGSQRACAGSVVAVGAGDEGAHRLENPGPEAALTVHVYGMNLADNPTGINRYYQ